MTKTVGTSHFEKHYDVIVAGGGTAGWVAALAAARHGAKTLLIEKKGYLGGTLATGLPLNGFFDARQHRVVGGYAHEFVEKLSGLGGAGGYHITDLWFGGQVFTEPALVRPVLHQMLAESGVEILLFSSIVDVVLENKSVKGVVTQQKNGQRVYTAERVVDASGDAVVCLAAGAEMQTLDEMQPPTLVFRLENVNLERLRAHLIRHPEDFMPGRMLPGKELSPSFLEDTEMFFCFSRLIDDVPFEGEYRPMINRFMFTATPSGRSITVNMLRALETDGKDSESLSRAADLLYRNLIPLLNTFRHRLPGFENCILGDTDPEIQLRETRRIEGLYVLTEEDVTSGRSFSDNIALGGYFIDIHSSKDSGGTWALVDQPYGLPYRSLLPKGVESLITAGRCISGTRVAAASFRVMAICMAMGQAAGTAAALSAEEGCSLADLDIKRLTETLQRDGAIIQGSETIAGHSDRGCNDS